MEQVEKQVTYLIEYYFEAVGVHVSLIDLNRIDGHNGA